MDGYGHPDERHKMSAWHPDRPGYVKDEALVERAVRLALPRRTRGYVPRWVAVADVLGMGSTTSAMLCKRFSLDPDEQVRADGHDRPARPRLRPKKLLPCSYCGKSLAACKKKICCVKCWGSGGILALRQAHRLKP